MKAWELEQAITGHVEDGRHANDEVVLEVGKERRSVTASHSDGTFVLIAGPPLSQ